MTNKRQITVDALRRNIDDLIKVIECLRNDKKLTDADIAICNNNLDIVIADLIMEKAVFNRYANKIKVQLLNK